jgi:hypothetical protein
VGVEEVETSGPPSPPAPQPVNEVSTIPKAIPKAINRIFEREDFGKVVQVEEGPFMKEPHKIIWSGRVP